MSKSLSHCGNLYYEDRLDAALEELRLEQDRGQELATRCGELLHLMEGAESAQRALERFGHEQTQTLDRVAKERDALRGRVYELEAELAARKLLEASS